jgi:hypothetical protein
MLANRRFSTYLPWLLIILIVIISFAFYFDGLNKYKAPPGCDYGNYLTQVDILRGNDLRGWGLQHNPVFFVFLDVFLRIFEDFIALKIVASLVFAIISIPFFLLAKKFSDSNLAALICTWLFVFFISNSEMISWGGSPNFLGFSFMLLTLLFFIDLMNQPSKKNLLLSGFFLSLVVGTHILVATYLLLLILVYFIATTSANKKISKVQIKSLFLMILIAIIFSLPYLSFYINFFINSSNEMLGFTVFSQIPPITFSSILGIAEFWPLFAVPIVFGLGLFGLFKYVKGGHKNNGLLLVSLILSPLPLALVTAQPIRWIYFLPIPMILCFGIYLKDVFIKIKNSTKTIQLLAICFIIIIGLYMTYVTYDHFDRAAGVYQFIDEDEIEALDWIKKNTTPDAILATSGHTKGDIGGGGNSYSWWVEGYSKRTCIPSGDLQYYSYQRQRDEVRIANRIFTGIYSFEYENIRVTESHPSSITNPEIAAFIDNEYQDMLTLNDAQHQLYFYPNEHEELFSYTNLFFGNSTSSIQKGDTWANFTVNSEQPYFDLVRSIIIGEDKSSVDVIFKILPKNSVLSLFKVNLWSLFKTSRENCRWISDDTVSISQAAPNKDVQMEITVLDGNVTKTDVDFEDPRNSPPVVSYSFEPVQNSFHVHIRIVIKSSVKDTNNIEKLRFYSSYDLLNDLHVDYILLNKGRDVQDSRFLAEAEYSEKFTNVFQSSFGYIKIYKVN